MRTIKDLKQDDTSGPCQIINFKEFNKYSGQWFLKFETRYYENYNALCAVQEILEIDGGDGKKYKAILKLSECKYSGPDFQKAMAARI